MPRWTDDLREVEPDTSSFGWNLGCQSGNLDHKHFAKHPVRSGCLCRARSVRTHFLNIFFAAI
jgi:hypothetical protein